MSKERQLFGQFVEQSDNLGNVYSSKTQLMVNMAGIGKGDRVLGIGCDTGSLVLCVKDAVGDGGRLTVLDGSRGADIMEFNCRETYNRIVCFNSVPRVSDTQSFFIKLRSMLAEDGFLVIMQNDRFLPAGTTTELLENLSFLVVDVIDNDELCFVKACKR